MISDGISFLASYQITGKPLIWTKNLECQEFTEIGKKMAESLYIIKDDEITKIGELLDGLLLGATSDYLKEKRASFVHENLIDKNNLASKKIVQNIYESFCQKNI